MVAVLDANLLVALAVDDSRAPAITVLLQRWLQVGEQLHAPALFPYEVASGLTRLVSAGTFPQERVPDAWQRVMAVPVIYHLLATDGDKVVNIAVQLRRKSAYDAAYIALAQQLDAELWTLDGPLARNAAGLGFPVQLVE